MCYYKFESKICSKTTISTVNSLHICWNLNVTLPLYVRPVTMGAFRGSVPKFLLCPETLVLNICRYENKNLLPEQFFFPQTQNLATGLLYASLYFQT